MLFIKVNLPYMLKFAEIIQVGFFLKKYLISIETEDSPRLQHFFSQYTFDKEKQNFVVKGIVGSALPTREYFKLAVAGKQRPLTPGELGCTLSHLAAYQDFLSSEEEYAIFFEDDAIENRPYDLVELEQKVRALNLDTGFLMSLGGIQLFYSRKVQGKFLSAQLYEQPILQIHPYFYKNLSSTYAYMIDRKMAKILVDFHCPPRGCDHWEELAYLESPPKLYATYLFEHPPIENLNQQSHIDLERKSVVEISSQSFTPWQKLKMSLHKKILKLLLASYVSKNN